MNTLYRVFGTLIIIGMATLGYAQEFGHHRGGPESEKAKALKVGVYTRVLQLSEDEATKFWPVYNRFHDQQDALRHQVRELMREIQNDSDKLSDAEIEAKIDKMIGLRKKEGELLETFYEESKEVLPIKKVALIPKAEMTYKRELLSQMRDKKRQ